VSNPAKATNSPYLETLRAKKAAIIREYKSRGCDRCGELHPATLDLHHVEERHPRLRCRKGNGQLRIGGFYWRDLSFADLETELKKCIVLCSNCHRKQHWDERNGNVEDVTG